MICGTKRALRGLAFGTLILTAAPLGGAHAQQPGGAGITPPLSVPAPSPAKAPKPTLADFAWLEGRWQGDWGPRVAEQQWMAPQAGMMLGTFRIIENDKVLVVELFVLLEKPNGIEFRLRHFTPDLVPWEKTNSTLLNLASLDPMKVVFANPVDGQPKHAILTRIDGDTYVSRSEIVPDKGDMQAIEITYHRQKAPPEQPSVGSGGRR